MNIYSILINKERKMEKNPIFIEEKFSFMAFLFQSLWLLYNKVWIAALIIILLEYGLFCLFDQEIISNQTFYGIKFVAGVFIALCANSWYLENLKRKNYEIIDIIAAKNLDEAKLRFYKKNLFNDEECDV